jgi:hypothetical protein
MLDEKMADDRFERKEKEDTVGILVGVDQIDQQEPGPLRVDKCK